MIYIIMSYFLVSTSNGQMKILPKLPLKSPFYSPLIAYNFNVEDLDKNITDSSYNFLLNYSTNAYDGSLNTITGIVSSFTNNSITVQPKFGSGCYYGYNGIYGNNPNAIRNGNWLNIQQFNIPTVTLNSGISVSLWFFLGNTMYTGLPYQLFVFNTQSSLSNVFRAYIGFNTSGIIVQTNNANYNSSGDTTFSNNMTNGIGSWFNNQWNHLVLTFQTTQITPTGTTLMSIYINNVLMTTTTLTNNYLTGNFIYNYIGNVGMINNTSYAFAGYLDNFRLYNSVLTPTQIATLYNDTTGYS